MESHMIGNGKIAFLALLLVIVFAAGDAFASWTYDGAAKTLADGNGWVLEFTESDDALTITGASAASTGSETLDLAQPIRVKEKRITAIGPGAFAQNGGLTALILPETLVSVGERAFDNCMSLVSVRPFLPDSVKFVGAFAFRGCSIADSLRVGFAETFAFGTNRGASYAFYGQKIPRIVFGPAVTELPSYVVGACMQCEEIVFEGDRPSINGDAFRDWPEGKSRWVIPSQKPGWAAFIAETNAVMTVEKMGVDRIFKYASVDENVFLGYAVKFLHHPWLAASDFPCPEKTFGPLWISPGDGFSRTNAAPLFKKAFVLKAKPRHAELRLAVAGWAEVSVNGRRVGDAVLQPVTCQPDLRLSELKFDVTDLLRVGTNEVRVLLGNGWWSCKSEEVWGFAHAPWHTRVSRLSGPMVRGALIADDQCVLSTDGSWMVEDSPIIFNQLRNGEYYDARREGKALGLRPAMVVGYQLFNQKVSSEDAPPCRVFERHDPVSSRQLANGAILYDFGFNVAGWCEIEVEGEAGAKVTIDYDEALNKEKTALKGAIARFNRNFKWPFQHDEYTLAGRPGGERWAPRFTYHGFKYAKVTIFGNAQVKSIKQCVVHSDLPTIGSIETSSVEFSKFQDAVRRSYFSNFVGIPTDCPHREKNGWTGDAQLICETGLWNFDAKAGYVHYLRMMLDAQTKKGVVPCILPCTPEFGFKWGTGPAWDMALFEIPRQIYRLTGDDSLAREAYPAMKRYLKYALTRREADGCYAYGLGDWCHFKGDFRVRPTNTAIIYHLFGELADWAEYFGEVEEAASARIRAAEVREAFNRVYSKGNGSYGGNSLTELAAALYFKGLCADGEREAVVSNLVNRVRAERHRAVFGILGAKWVPRALAEAGYIEDAWKIFVQKEFPSFQGMLDDGGTLWEAFNGGDSLNHIMFGDGSAWAFEYVAGIVPVEPGFKAVAIATHPIPGVASFRATHRTPYGEISAGWETKDGRPVCTYSVPEGVRVVRVDSQAL